MKHLSELELKGIEVHLRAIENITEAMGGSELQHSQIKNNCSVIKKTIKR